MAAAAYRQIAEVQQSQGSEEQQEPPQKKLRLRTTEAVFAHRHRRFHNEVDLCWDKAYHDATRQGLPEWQVLEMANDAYSQRAEVQRLRAIVQYEQEKHDRLLEKNTKLVQEYRELRESECRRLCEEAERLQKDPKEKSANDWAECYLKGSAASAHAKMMNATSVSHASRTVDSDMQRMCLCRSCGGWIIFP